MVFPFSCYFTTHSLLYLLSTIGLMFLILAVNIGLFTCSCIVIIKHACKVRQLKRKKSDRQAQRNSLMFAKKACKMNCGLLGIICLLGLPNIVVYGVTLLELFFLQSCTLQDILLFIVQAYYIFQGLILFLLVTVPNSDLRNQWKKLLCGCIMKNCQASSRQELHEHAKNRTNKTNKMAQGISKGQHQDENMEELHVTNTHTSHNIVKNTNTLHVNMLDHHQQTSYSIHVVQNSTVNYQVLVSLPIYN